MKLEENLAGNGTKYYVHLQESYSDIKKHFLFGETLLLCYSIIVFLDGTILIYL